MHDYSDAVRELLLPEDTIERFIHAVRTLDPLVKVDSCGKTLVLRSHPAELTIVPVAHRRRARTVSVLVLPGTSHGEQTRYQLTKAAKSRIRHASDHLIKDYDLVIASGFGEPGSEARQIAALLPTGTPILLDTLANSTAANAVNTGWLLSHISPTIARVDSVASISNAFRQHLLFSSSHHAYRRTHTLLGATHHASWKPGIVGLFYMQKHSVQAKEYLQKVGGNLL